MTSNISAKNLFDEIKGRLSEIYSPDEAREMAFMILENVENLSKTDVLADKHVQIRRHDLESWLQRLSRHEPIQYIIGKAEFCGRMFEVNPAVLIPRNETEELVYLIIRENKNLTGISVCDVGTGSGCIAITLSNALAGSSVYALDVSPHALEVALRNANKHAAEIDFIHADIRDKAIYPRLPLLDVIVSNPPYVMPDEMAEMQQHVLAHEPHLALFTPADDALLYYKAVLQMAKERLKKKGKIYFEINQRYGSETKALMEHFDFVDIEILHDMNNKIRFAKGIYNPH